VTLRSKKSGTLAVWSIFWSTPVRPLACTICDYVSQEG
jgi:hypothetical protein